MMKKFKQFISNIKLLLIRKWLGELELVERHKVLTMAVRKGFSSITEDDILQVKGVNIYFKGKKISDETLKLLKAEATTFSTSKLWEVLRTDIEYQANSRMFFTSQTEFDLIAGKMVLFTLDIIKTVLDRITQSKNGM